MTRARAAALIVGLVASACAPRTPARDVAPEAAVTSSAEAPGVWGVPTEPAVPAASRCASEIAETRVMAESIDTPPTPPSPASGVSPPSRLRELERRVRELRERVAHAAAPVRVEIRARTELPPSFVVESVRIWLDDQPVAAVTGADAVAAHVVDTHVAAGDHAVRLAAVLRGNFSGGIYDSVGYCFVTSSGYAFSTPAQGTVELQAILEQGDPTALFSDRPRVRYVGAPPAKATRTHSRDYIDYGYDFSEEQR